MSVLAVDLGAAHVDLAWHDADCTTGQGVALWKHPRRDLDMAASVLAAIDATGRSPVGVESLRLATTLPLNALLGAGRARVALITTAGFGDVLALGRQDRADLYDSVARHPLDGMAAAPLVAASDIHMLEARADSAGAIVAAVDPAALAALVARLQADPPQAVAISLVFGHLAPQLERQVAQAVQAAVPGCVVACSHRVDPQPREFERTLATVIEAALAPLLRDALTAIMAGLARRGVHPQLLLADGAGALQPARALAGRLSAVLEGGPAAAATLAAEAAAAIPACPADRPVLMLDMGAASMDLVLLDGARPALSRFRQIAGLPLRRVAVDGESTALGGAARPLGAGTLRLDEALREVCAPAPASAPAPEPAQTSPQAVIAAAIEQAAQALMGFCTRRNLDPARVVLVPMGGLGAPVAARLARRLGMPAPLAVPGAACGGALGLLRLRESTHRVWPLALSTAAITPQVLSARRPRPPATRLLLEAAPQPGQHPMDIPLSGWPETGADLATAFNAAHATRFGLARSGPVHAFSLQIWHEGPALPALPLIGDVPAGAAGAPGVATAPAPALSYSLQPRLDGIAQAMQQVLFRTAVSPVVREGADAASALFTPGGTLLALSQAIPLLLGALPGAVAAILRDFPPATMQPGDAFVMNDPFDGGTHLPDLTVLCPVFADAAAGGALIGHAVSILHHQDVGGMRAGSVPPDAVEIHQEGLRLPPMPLMRAGQPVALAERLIRANSRAPDIVWGDLSAQLAAAGHAAAMLRRLTGEYGAAAFDKACARCLADGEAAARAALCALPAGPHLARDGLDPSPALGAVDVRLAMSIDPDAGILQADFAGTSAPVAAPINCVASGPLSALVYGLFSLLPATAPRNGGALRVLRMDLPPGSVINAAPPSAVNARMGLVRVTTSTVLAALALAAPGRRPAANSGMSFVIAFSGRGHDGAAFHVTEIVAGGAGGGPDADGADGISTDVGNAMNMPAEALEAMAPLRLLVAEVRRGSGGAGRFRGGHGIRRVYLALADDIAVSLRGDRFQRVPEGAFGGGRPQPAAARVERQGGVVDALPARAAVRLMRGDRLVVESAGGAGYGAPADAGG
ncbi:MAG: hydantoinase B/oxoprolinase family protein [Pararhodobacter sp.]|nr:hydantoinase B/oxoprolinase family protein [Pararhodobacter sp.]